mgnify:FL=1
MVLSILILITVVFILIIFVLSFPASKDSQTKELEAKHQEKHNENLEKTIKKFKGQIGLLEVEIKKEKENSRRLKEDLDKTVEREAVLLHEKKIESIEKEGLENTKKELGQVKRRLVDKDKAFDAEYSLNLRLKKDLEEKKSEIDLFKKDSRQMTDYIRKLELEMKKLQEKISGQEKSIIDLEKKQTESNWVSKKEYFKIEKELAGRIEEIDKLRSELEKKSKG